MDRAELRQAIFQQKSSPVGKRIHWAPDQLGELREMIFSAPEKTLRAAVQRRKFVAQRSNVVRTKLAEAGAIAPAGDPSGASRFLFVISDESVDRAGDTIALSGWNLAAFSKNPAVLLSHDSAALPVARSSIPTSSAGALVAVADFSASDSVPAAAEVRGAVRAGLVKGASVGFRPIKFKLSSDPDRPMGLDFLQQELLEWSICSVPCNANCVMLGVAGKTAQSADLKATPLHALSRPERVLEAAAIVRSIRRNLT